MSPRLEEARRFLRLARRDHATFSLLVRLPEADLAALGFHAQQAAEKALKAVAVFIELPVPRTHDLVALGAAIQECGLVLPVELDELRLLNPFAVEYRYDDELHPVVSREELARLLEILLSWSANLPESP